MKNKTKKIALYNPYLDTLGGGEKHIFSIIEVFSEKGYEINIFWGKNISKEIKDRFSFQYIDKLKWLPNIFRNNSSPLKTLQALKSYDYFFYVTDGSYFFSSANNNYVFCMVPDKKLFHMNLINKLKLFNYKFISNSPYTTKWLAKWGIDPVTITPYVDNKLFIKNKSYKENIILSVGRFFSHLHNKRQDLMIKAFEDLKKRSKEFADYKLILAGGLKKEDQKYFDQLKKEAKNDLHIIFKPNIKLDELYKLYKLANYFWHFTGYGIDEKVKPELVEHFGITPLEAMASGCLTFCYSAGGPKELIIDGKNGFLFTDTNQLINKMIAVDSNSSIKERVIINAGQFVKENYSYKVFKEKVKDSLL